VECNGKRTMKIGLLFAVNYASGSFNGSALWKKLISLYHSIINITAFTKKCIYIGVQKINVFILRDIREFYLCYFIATYFTFKFISISVINVNVKFIYSLAIKSSFLRILKLSGTKPKQRELIIATAIYYFILFHARNVYFCIPT